MQEEWSVSMTVSQSTYLESLFFTNETSFITGSVTVEKIYTEALEVARSGEWPS
jgi:hypothetical protein